LQKGKKEGKRNRESEKNRVGERKKEDLTPKDL